MSGGNIIARKFNLYTIVLLNQESHFTSQRLYILPSVKEKSLGAVIFFSIQFHATHIAANGYICFLFILTYLPPSNTRDYNNVKAQTWCSSKCLEKSVLYHVAPYPVHPCNGVFN